MESLLLVKTGTPLMGESVLFLLTGIGNHLDACDLHVAVLGVALLNAAILCSFFGVFLHVMHLRIRHDPGCRYCVPHMFAKGHATSYFPSAAVVPGEQKLTWAVTFGQAAPNRRLHVGSGASLDK